MISILIKLSNKFKFIDSFAEKFVIAFLQKRKSAINANQEQKKLLEEKSRIELQRISKLEKIGDRSASRLELVK